MTQGRDPAHLLERFDRRAAMSETLYLALRTAEGMPGAWFRQRFGASLEEVFGDAARSCGGHLETDADRWRFTLSGWLLYDHLVQHFLP